MLTFEELNVPPEFLISRDLKTEAKGGMFCNNVECFTVAKLNKTFKIWFSRENAL